MNAGSYDTPITIERKTVTKEPAYGSAVETWESISGAYPIWANVQDARPSRSEAVRQGLAVATNQTTVKVRYRPDVDSSMRITIHRDTDQIYQIVGGPAILGRKEELEMVVESYSTETA